jgi:hypothetical protein
MEAGAVSTTSATGRARAAAIAVLILFVALSLTVVGVLVWNVYVNGAIWTGSVGYVFDSMQYLAWIREGADHFLAGNLFSFEPPVRNYLNPGLIISSGLSLLGLSIPLAYAFWIPVGIAALIWVVRKFTAWLELSGWTAVAVIALALLYKIPAARLLEAHVPVANFNALTYAGTDAWPVYWSWGFSLTAISVALLCLGIMRYDKVRSLGARASWSLMAIALFCSWLQPWQGAILLALIVGGEVIAGFALKDRAGLRGRVTLLATTVVAGTLPLAYYAILGKVDESWRINGVQANTYVSGVSWWTPFALLLPLLLGAAFAYRARPASYRDIAIRLWPLVAIAEMLTIQATKAGNTSTHSLKGITFPLAVLAVAGTAPLFAKLAKRSAGGAAALAVVVVGLLFVPGAITQVDSQLKDMSMGQRGGYYYVNKHDEEALKWLTTQKGPGNVFASSLYGSMVPWRTDRSTWVGHETWTPRFQGRSYFNENLLDGHLPAIAFGLSPAAVVKWSGARWVFQDCYRRMIQRASKYPTLDSQLAPIVESTHKFGCATIWVIKPGKGPAPAGIDRYHLTWRPTDG